MTRGKRLFNRLDSLEREYRQLVTKACRNAMGHTSSMAAFRALRPNLFEGKKWRNKEAGHLEWLEKEIQGLRRKLSLPLNESPVSELHQLRDAIEDASDGEDRRLIRDFIDRQSRAAGQAT